MHPTPPPPPSSNTPPVPPSTPPPRRKSNQSKEQSKKSKTYSIQCTNCGAPLDILGGGRVSTVTCQYCNSVLDLNQEYKVLSKFQEKFRPEVPFTLGMQGKIKGVEWTIIGWVAYKTPEYPVERWSEFFLYSPLYGYAWLVYEEGDISFSKRMRDFPLREWQDDGKPTTLKYRDRRYLLAEESYMVEIEFVQGELSWIAKADDRIKCWDYNGTKRESLSIEQSGSEIEVYLNQRIDPKLTYAAFGVAKEKQTKAKQSALDEMFDEESMEESEKALSLFAKGTALFVVVLLIFMLASAFTSKTLVSNKNSTPFTQNFSVTSDAFVSQITLKAANPGLLNTMRLTIFKGNEKIFYIDSSTIFSKNKKILSTWKRGDYEATISIKLEKGAYRAKLEHTRKLQAGERVSVEITQGVMRLSYILPLFIVMLIFLLPSLLKNMLPLSVKKFVWWGLAGVIAVSIWGGAALVFVGVLYFFIRPMIEGKTYRGNDDE